MSHSSETPPQDESDGISPDDALPPVEPPSAKFILQLFVYPLVIVGALVGAGLLINWVTRLGSNPNDYIAALERNNDARWQAAMNLAEVLSSPGNEEFKRDSAQARRLIAILDREIALANEKGDGAKEDESVQLRVFLCRALGEFHTADGLDVLIRAATTQNTKKDLTVRGSALEAIAVLVDRANQKKLVIDDDQKIIDLLLEATTDPEPEIQYRAAFVLGFLDHPATIDRLLELIRLGSHPSVRYNAATGLARHGRAESINVLLEMLDLETVVDVSDAEKLELKRDALRLSRDMLHASILENGLKGTRLLANNNPSADLTPLGKAVDALLAADLEDEFEFHRNESARRIRELAVATRKILSTR